MSNDFIPWNGRIAIVDDNVNQALPLMRVFSKNNIPYVFYKGNDISYLPEDPENDIRVLFLDLNLLGGLEVPSKNIRATLISLIKHIISPTNYPYILVLWSRQEKEYGDLLREIFYTELNKCAPIGIFNYVKSDFFPYFAEEEDSDNPVDDNKILEELNKILLQLPAYSHLMQWENCVHASADATIQDIFHDMHSKEDWQNNANYIFEAFAHAHLEQHYRDATLEEKAKSSLMFLNDVYNDTLEGSIRDLDLSHAQELKSSVDTEMRQSISAKINEHILFSKANKSVRQPGSIFVEEGNNGHSILNDCIRTEDLREQVKQRFQLPNIKEARNIYNQLVSERRKAIEQTMSPCCNIIVTPACDYAQNKIKFDRIVQGIIIESKYQKLIDNQSEAIYISPVFAYQDKSCILVLNFRYFLTRDLSRESTKPIFKLRNRMLAEIQSKLARHINRQGIMNL